MRLKDRLLEMSTCSIAVFARAVRRRRLAMCISQAELARRMRINSKSLHNLERARNWPSLPIYFRLVRELGAGVPPLSR